MLEYLNILFAGAAFIGAMGAIAAMNGTTCHVIRLADILVAVGMVAQILTRWFPQIDPYANTLVFGGVAALLFSSRRSPVSYFERWGKPVGAVVGVIALAATFLSWSNTARAQDLDGPQILVASPQLQGGYRGTVILAVPFPTGGHIGVILNRPTEVTMAQAFPDHEASKAVRDHIYVGGPQLEASGEARIVALAKGPSVHPSDIPVAKDLWLVVNGAAVDAVIEARPNDARYFVGYVGWRPGELAQELRKGYFIARPLDREKLFLPDTSNLWRNLAPRKGEVQT